MGERPARRRRVLIEDARRNDQYLRATWHDDRGQFVISTWRADVCTGAARISAADGAALAGLLVDGLADAAAAPAAAPPADGPAPARRSTGAAALVDRARRWLAGLLAPDRPGPSPRPGPPPAGAARRRRSA
jgi:hypothetical protein